ncbi:hypothetical protein [Streptomyces sp. NPDC057428]
MSAELPGQRWANIEELRAKGLFGVPQGNGSELRARPASEPVP